MSAFFGRGRTTPPHGLIELDRSNPLTNGLVGAYTPGGQNAVTRTFAETLTATKGVSRQGPALLFAAGSETAKFDSYLPTNVFTSLTLLTPNFSSASTTRQGIWMFQASAGSVQNRLRLIWLDATNGFYLDTNSGYAYWCKPTFSAGDALSIAYVRSGTGGINQFYINGRPQTTNRIVDVGGGIPASATPMWLGDDIESSSGRRLNGAIALHLHYSRALSAPELKSLQDNPWQIFSKLPRRLFDAGASGAYTLTAAQGTYTLTGQSVNLTIARRVTADQGTYTLSGQNVTLRLGKTLTAAQGAYTLTGQSASLLVSRQITMAQGSYTLTGQDVTLTKSGGDKTLTAGQGTYTLTGQDVSLSLARKLTAEQGTYTLNGQDAGLNRNGRVLQAAQGTYTLNGQEVTLNYSGQPPNAYDIVLARRRLRK